LNFDWEAPRTSEGYYLYEGTVEACARRGKEYLKVADCLWMETATPEVKDAKLLSELLSNELKVNKFLCYNLSPSFNWNKFGLDDKTLSSFCTDLAKFGYHWQVPSYY
jgi:isocitrate lyase